MLSYQIEIYLLIVVTFEIFYEILNVTNQGAAVYLVKKYDTEFPEIYFQEFLQYIDSSEEEFWATVNKHRSPHIWKEVNGEWQLRHNVSLTGIDD